MLHHPRFAARALLFAAAAIACPAVLPAAALTGGAELQVNQTTAGRQDFSHVATSPNGRFLVTWESDPSGNQIPVTGFARLFLADGTPASPELEMPMLRLRGDIDDSGRAIVVGRCFTPTSSLCVRRFLADGTLDGADVKIAPLNWNYGRPAVALDPDGGFLVVWPDPQLRARRYDSQGNPSAVFPITSYHLFGNFPTGLARIAALPQGGWLVVWMNPQGGLHYRFVTAGGAFDGPEGELPSVTWDFSLAGVDAAGNFDLAWRGEASTPLWPSHHQVAIYSGHFDRDGNPLAVELVAGAEHDVGMERRIVASAIDGQGNSLVVWNFYSPPLSAGYDVFGRFFGADGAPAGRARQMHEYAGYHQRDPTVAAQPNGFVVVWQVYDGDNLGVTARVFTSTP